MVEWELIWASRWWLGECRKAKHPVTRSLGLDQTQSNRRLGKLSLQPCRLLSREQPFFSPRVGLLRGLVWATRPLTGKPDALMAPVRFGREGEPYRLLLSS